MTGKTFLRNNRDNMVSSYKLPEFEELENVEWFARAIRTRSTFNGDIRLVEVWSKWFTSRNIPWVTVDTKMGITLYKKPWP